MNWIAHAVFVLLSMKLALPNMDRNSEIEKFGKEYKIIASRVHKTCETTCKKAKMFCNFDAYPKFSHSEIEILVKNENIRPKFEECNTENINWPYPYVLENQNCIHHSDFRDWQSTPACKVAAPFDNVELICFCRREFDFKKKNEIIVGKAQQTCSETCNKIDLKCDFEDYGKLKFETMIQLLNESVASSKLVTAHDECPDRNSTILPSYPLSTTDPVAWMQKRNIPPGFDEITRCIFGFVRDPNMQPACDKKSNDANVKLLCTCKKRNEFKKTNKLILGKIGENCNDACSADANMECNFEKYAALSQDEVVELLNETLWSTGIPVIKDKCYASGTNAFFTTNKDHITETTTNSQSLFVDTTCISGFVRLGKPTAPNCTTVMPDRGNHKLRRFCSCVNRTKTSSKGTTGQTTTFVTTTKPVMKILTTAQEYDLTTINVFVNSVTPQSSVSPFFNSTEDAARQARINKKYVADAVTKMYILAAVMVVVEVILLGFLVREIRRNRALDKKEEEETKLREAERRRNKKAKAAKRPKRYSRNQRQRRS